MRTKIVQLKSEMSSINLYKENQIFFKRKHLLVNSPVEVDERRDGNDARDEHPGQVDVVESVVGVVPQVSHPEPQSSRHVHHLSHVAKLVKQRHLCV